MTTKLDNFLSCWFYFMIISFGIGIIGFILILVNKKSKSENKNKRIKIGVILFTQVFITWFVGFGTLWIIQKRARQELVVFLKQPNLKVTIDNNLVDDEYSCKVINELKTVWKVNSHHSSPTERIEIKIDSNDETIILSIERDSQYNEEYWIFWNKYKTTKSNELGRIRTSIFDNKNGG